MKKPGPAASHLDAPLRAIPFLRTDADAGQIVLTDRQRAVLAGIAMRIRLPARMQIYREGDAAEWVFSIVEGAVKSYRDLPSGTRVVSAFLFTRDLFGLAEAGRYLNTLQAITSVTLYRFPLKELSVLLKHDGDLQFQFLSKVTHELRESQRRAIVVNRRDATGRLAMFLALMDRRNVSAAHDGTIALPMTRSDIAAFLGLSPETVGRAAAELERRRLVRFENRHLARVLDAARLQKLIDDI